MSTRIGILGYGNLARGVECAVHAASDMTLTAVFSRRDPSSIKLQKEGVPVLPVSALDEGRDDIDVLVLCADPIYPMTLIRAFPIGGVRMIDGGRIDDKIIAIPFSDPTYHGIQEVAQLPSHIFDEIMHFFSVYKQLENKQTDVQTLYDRATAEKIVQDAMDSYTKTYCK